ncbi:hypothetical protein K503DRAFT_127757 [Rhizopogon vinicolor AM-OR11-026]|uniref:Uncharacterized protein n=1 Tax=Rhizopogon vinicolor AM-OR11-026 TaxID=1314800 RepID=A0A1B7N226_9AGAM|nr:hypothetical protein K503DRAFT_127757 [Rhizopogon vinicolor AM-OR11-026]
MPRVAAARTKLMTKEVGGKVQVAFRNSLGLCESEDPQFQEIKHFKIGLKPREQEKHCKGRFLDDVYKAYPILQHNNHAANNHLLTYIDGYLRCKAVPSSRFYRRDDKSDKGSESTVNFLDPPYHEETPTPAIRPRTTVTPEPDEKDEETPRLEFDSYAYSDHRRTTTLQKRIGVALKPSIEHSPRLSPSLSSGRAGIRSPSLYASEIPLTEQLEQTPFHERPNCNKPSRTSTTSQTLVSGQSLDVSSIKNFLSHAQLGHHLFEELIKLGIKNKSRLHLVAAWPERDIDELLRDSVRESRIDRFEALQLNVAFRSVRRSLVSTDFDDA